jgi:hypothetical protein
MGRKEGVRRWTLSHEAGSSVITSKTLGRLFFNCCLQANATPVRGRSEKQIGLLAQWHEELRGNMKAALRIVVAACLLLVACGPSPQSLILGRWEVENAPTKMVAEFRSDGTATISIFGHTVQGTYKLNGTDELEWSMNGMSTKAKVKVTATDLELTDNANRTIKYKRK